VSKILYHSTQMHTTTDSSLTNDCISKF